MARVTITDVAVAAGVSKTAVSFAFNNPERLGQGTLDRLLVPPLDGSLEGAIRAASVDGFISLGLGPDDPAIKTMDRLGIPMVLVDSEDSPGHPAVNVDDAGGAEAAARHLLKLGHRELAL